MLKVKIKMSFFRWTTLLVVCCWRHTFTNYNNSFNAILVYIPFFSRTQWLCACTRRKKQFNTIKCYKCFNWLTEMTIKCYKRFKWLTEMSIKKMKVKIHGMIVNKIARISGNRIYWMTTYLFLSYVKYIFLFFFQVTPKVHPDPCRSGFILTIM